MTMAAREYSPLLQCQELHYQSASAVPLLWAKIVSGTDPTELQLLPEYRIALVKAL